MPLHRRAFVFAASAAPVLASCSTNPWWYRHSPPAALVRRMGVCAAVVATLRGGRPQAPVALGGCETTPAADGIFQAASLTKPVAAYAALKLVQAGALDLAAPVSRYLPGGYRHFRSVLRRGADDASDTVPAALLTRIPVGTLLNHSSGLPNWSPSGLDLSFAPGERWQYSGEAYVLLQSIIEAVAGRPFASFIDERVFQVLGMRDSRLGWQDSLAPRAVPGLAADGTVNQAVFRHPVAAASLYTTAADYAAFMAAVAADAPLLALTLSRPVGVDRGLGLEWGYGWGIERTGPDAVLWQWGNNPGFRSFAMFHATSRDGFVLLTNSDNGMPLASALAHQSVPGDHNAFRFPMVR